MGWGGYGIGLGMLLRTWVPRPPLSDLVELLWFAEGTPATHAKERLLPTGTMELVINLRDDAMRVYESRNTQRVQSFRGSVVCGAHSGFFVIDTANQASVMGVHFKPGGAFPFFKTPADELRDAHVSLETLWGAAAGALRDQLLGAETVERRFYLLEQTLLAQARRPLARHPAVGFALKEFHAAPARAVSAVTGQIGLSARRFIEVFGQEVGLTPKQFCRIRRFQNVLRRVHHRQEVDWVDVALECGYFDQAHFIHDFRGFSGLNPTTYLAQQDEHLNHVPIRE
jgi:AraC-like DNA-binding protein